MFDHEHAGNQRILLLEENLVTAFQSDNHVISYWNCCNRLVVKNRTELGGLKISGVLCNQAGMPHE